MDLGILLMKPSRVYDWHGTIDPYLPTVYPPGSPEKIRVMQIRAELELPLHHNEDNKDVELQVCDSRSERFRVVEMATGRGRWF